MPAHTRRAEPLRLTAAQCRAVDRYAIEELGFPGPVLMENAGRNAAELIARWAGSAGGPAAGSAISGQTGGRAGKTATVTRRPISVICGKGNNGGDGFVIARHLANRGFDVWAYSLSGPAGLTPDAATHYAIAEKMGLPLRPLDGPRALNAAARRWSRSAVVVDALLGTGFTGEVRAPLAKVIRRINALDGPLIVAIDIPSGLNADTGEPGGIAIQADHTITFLAPKTGYVRRAARAYTGRVTVVDIGAPLGLILSRLGLADSI